MNPIPVLLKFIPRPNGKRLGSLGHDIQEELIGDKDNPQRLRFGYGTTTLSAVGLTRGYGMVWRVRSDWVAAFERSEEVGAVE
jgi:hypothetical protein